MHVFINMKCIIIPKGTFDPSKTSIVRIPPLTQINGPLVVIPAKKKEISRNGSLHKSQQFYALLNTEAEKKHLKTVIKSVNLHKCQHTINLNKSRKYTNDQHLVGTNANIVKSKTTFIWNGNNKRTAFAQMNSNSIQTQTESCQESQNQNLVNYLPQNDIKNKEKHINRQQRLRAIFQIAETNRDGKCGIKNGIHCKKNLCTTNFLEKQSLWNERKEHLNSSSNTIANACVQKSFYVIKEDCANNTDQTLTEDVACGDSCFKMTTDVCCGSNCCVSIVARNKNKRPKSSVHFDDYVHFVASEDSELKAYSNWDITDTKDPLKRAKMLQNYLKIKKRLQFCQS